MSVSQTTLTVAAAADLAPLQPRLAKATPIAVRFVNEASALLAQQIENGAPYDVFLSANAQYIDELALNGKLAPGSVNTYAVGRVAVLWKDSKHHPLSDLQANWVRFVALPNPRLAPYGVAAEQALRHAGLWKSVQPKIVYGENVRQALQLFDSGNADVVLTAASLVHGRVFDPIPADWHQPIVQKAGIVTASPNRAAAQEFLEFLLSPPAQAVFAEFGFGPAKPSGEPDRRPPAGL